MRNIGCKEIGEVLRSAFAQGLVREEDTSAIFFDLGYFESRIRHLASCFPSTTLHGLAAKANPLAAVMKKARDIGPNTGVEAASAGEVNMALRAGYPPGQVVFDSPVKTIADLEFALSAGVRLNVDNLAELERVNKLIRPGSIPEGGSVGLRINPQVGTGTIAESSVAGDYSKFGVPVRYRREALEKAFLACPWLTGVHLHVGSQGCSVQMLTDGIGIVYDFVLEMNLKRKEIGLPAVTVFDIGGGLPVSYLAGTPAPSMEAYAAGIRKRAPQLFDPGSFQIITEFGRWVYTNAGWTLSRVEYVKRDRGINTAMIHVGADLFVRECLSPANWQHEYSLFDPNGVLKSGEDDQPYNLAGPLCFSGDILARDVVLPVAAEGDYLVIHDTGGYTFSMWSRYNSRQTPRIIGYRNEVFEILKERETLDSLLASWE